MPRTAYSFAWIGSSYVDEVRIDFDAAGGVDLDLYTTSHPRCDCGDYLWRERICKHILAALLREGNERVVTTVPRLLARANAA